MGWHMWCHRESRKGTGNVEESAAALSHHRPGLPGHDPGHYTRQPAGLHKWHRQKRHEKGMCGRERSRWEESEKDSASKCNT